MAKWGSTCTGTDQLQLAIGVASGGDGNGNVYVGDRDLLLVKKFACP